MFCDITQPTLKPLLRSPCNGYNFSISLHNAKASYVYVTSSCSLTSSTAMELQSPQLTPDNAPSLSPSRFGESLFGKVERTLPVDRKQPILNLVQQIEEQLTQLEQFILTNSKTLQTDP